MFLAIATNMPMCQQATYLFCYNILFYYKK